MSAVSDSVRSPLLPLTIRELIDRRVAEDPSFVYCRFGDEALTLGALDARVNRFANGLLALGLARGDRIAVMLPNHPDYVVAFLACARIGLCQVPVNINLKGAGLAYVLEHSKLHGLILDARLAPQVAPELKPGMVDVVIVRGGAGTELAATAMFEEIERRGAPTRPRVATQQSDELLISYTSGTTGVPKGVLVTDKMLQACGYAARTLADVRRGDVLYLWEPIYHIAGCEVLIVALLERVTLALAERFSVSRFWSDVRRYRATHIHFFGGVLGLLLKEPPSTQDRQHGARIAWGGGCPISIWTKFQHRFGTRIRECYGMTEASSFTTLNTDEKVGSIGKPLPYFEVRIADEEGRFLGPNQRGENISAWEVERVLNEHPAVAESAVIGVENEISDQDIKAFLRLKPGERLEAPELIRWCEPRMASFQLPRYIAFIDEFPKTPTERIRKELLPRSTDGCFDRENWRGRDARGQASN
jgi:crotonobetaine/carnitine-CoA ligase